MIGIVSFGCVTSKGDRLIADHTDLSVVGSGIDTSQSNVMLGSDDKECTGLTQGVKTSEIEIAAIHHVKRARLGWQEVQNIDLVHLPVADVDTG